MMQQHKYVAIHLYVYVDFDLFKFIIDFDHIYSYFLGYRRVSALLNHFLFFSSWLIFFPAPETWFSLIFLLE